MILLTLLQNKSSTVPNRRRRAWTWLAILLAGYLLFAHGCHGGEDDELFVRAIAGARPAAVIQVRPVMP